MCTQEGQARGTASSLSRASSVTSTTSAMSSTTNNSSRAQTTASSRTSSLPRTNASPTTTSTTGMDFIFHQPRTSAVAKPTENGSSMDDYAIRLMQMETTAKRLLR